MIARLFDKNSPWTMPLTTKNVFSYFSNRPRITAQVCMNFYFHFRKFSDVLDYSPFVTTTVDISKLPAKLGGEKTDSVKEQNVTILTGKHIKNTCENVIALI